jgi:alpha-1,6-mannosyltransferase
VIRLAARAGFGATRIARPLAQVSLAPALARSTRAPATRRTTSLVARPALQLTLAAGLIACIYGLLLVAPLPVWAGHPVGPASVSGPPPGGAGWPGLVVTLGFVLALCLPFRPYALAVRATTDARVAGRLALGLTALLAGVGLLIYPRFGSDLFDYIGYERLWAIYHHNPLTTPASRQPLDWAYTFVWFRDQAPAYGPVWALLTWPVVLLVGEDAVRAVAAYKLLALASYLACCGLIWASVEPARRVRSLVLFAWSPLVLLEVLGKVHNDGITAAMGLAAIVLAGRVSGASGLVAAVATALLKASAAAIAPPILLRDLRLRAWPSLAVGLIVGGGVCGLLYAPFWAGPETLGALVHQTSRVVWSPGTLLIAVTDRLPGGPYTMLARAGLVLTWAVGCLLVLWRARLDSLARLATTSGYLLVLTLLLLTTAFFSHYLVPAIALAAISGDRRLERLVLALSIGGLAAYGVEPVGLATGPGWIDSREEQVLGSLVTLVPAALVWMPWLLRGKFRASGWLRRRG